MNTDGDLNELGHLYRWMSRDPDVRRCATVRPGLSSWAGSMNAMDAIDIVLTHGAALTQVALAWAAWRRSRREAPTMNLTINGNTVVLGDNAQEILQEIARLAGTGTSGEADSGTS